MCYLLMFTELMCRLRSKWLVEDSKPEGSPAETMHNYDLISEMQTGPQLLYLLISLNSTVAETGGKNGWQGSILEVTESTSGQGGLSRESHGLAAVGSDLLLR